MLSSTNSRAIGCNLCSGSFGHVIQLLKVTLISKEWNFVRDDFHSKNIPV